MYSGKRCSRKGTDLRDPCAVIEHQVRDEALVSGCHLVDRDGGLLHQGMGGQRDLHLAELDAVSPYL